jgi:hypothetical protein
MDPTIHVHPRRLGLVQHLVVLPVSICGDLDRLLDGQQTVTPFGRRVTFCHMGSVTDGVGVPGVQQFLDGRDVFWASDDVDGVADLELVVGVGEEIGAVA